MNILLTGATGFLGSNLLARLLEEGHAVTVLVRPTSSLERIAPLLERISVHTVGNDIQDELFRSNRIETIIHCATNYGRGTSVPVEILESNLILPLRLLQCGCRTGVRCFINTDTILDKSVSDYALSKGQFREWLGNYARKMTCVNLALEHFYGPHDDPKKFVSFIVKQLLDEADSIDLTLGEQRRDFIHIDDIVSAFLLILGHCASQECGCHNFEIGTGRTISIREFVELIKQISGNTRTRLNFGAIPYRENEAMATNVDNAAICALGWKPETSLFAGLSRMIAIEREARSA